MNSLETPTRIIYLFRRPRYTKIKYIISMALLIELLFILKFQKSLILPKSIWARKELGLKIFNYWHNASKDLKVYLKPDAATAIQKPRNFIDPIYLLVVVCSASQNFEARRAIRATWGNMKNFNYLQYVQNVRQYNLHQYMLMEPDQPGNNIKIYSVHKYYNHLLNLTFERDKNFAGNENANISNFDDIKEENAVVKVLFLTGVPETASAVQALLYAENRKHGDIIQENFIDSYGNLSIKTGMLLKWVCKYSKSNISFVLKVDDDVYVNLYKLVYKLRHMQVPSKILIGSIISNAKPITDHQSKYYNPTQIYNHEFYPEYLVGPAYLMTFEAAKKLYETALNTRLLQLEDVYYTGICALLAGIPLLHSKVFLRDSDSLIHCEFSYYIASHKMSPARMIYLFRQCNRNRLNPYPKSRGW